MKKIFISFALILLACSVILLLRPNSKEAPSIVTDGTYVALGDSVAAGVGLMNDSDSSACDRTNQSYPNQVAQQQNYKLINLACSGANIPAGILGSQTVNQLALDPQITQLFSQSKPWLITLTVGANDIHWTDIIKACYVASCDNGGTVAKDLVAVKVNLAQILDQLKQHYGQGTPQIMVTGYHQVFPAANSAGCSDLIGIDEAELARGRAVQSSLNQTIEDTVRPYSFAHYVAVDFTGHELCTADPWVQGLADKKPYHPTAAGEKAYAKAIISSQKSVE
jgi:lysophospholipase L1-like esterase